MIWKNIYAKTLLAFFVCLTPVSLAGCNQAPINNDSYNDNSNQQADVQNNINREIDELDKSIDILIREIQAQKDEDKESFKLDNLQNVSQKIQKISTDIQNIYQTQSVKLPENSEKLLNNIQERIENIKKIIEPLINGLNKNSVGQVQEHLGIFKVADRNGKKKDYGTLGDATKGKISNYLTQNKNNLIQDIDRLLGNDINSQVRTLSQQVKELQEQSKNNNKPSLIELTSLILSFISLLLFATLLLERGGFSALSNMFQNRRNEEKSDKISNTPADSSSFDPSQISNNKNQIKNTSNNEEHKLHSRIIELENKINRLQQFITKILEDQESTGIQKTLKNQTNHLLEESRQQNQQGSNQFLQYPTEQPSNLQISVPNLLAAYNNDPGSLFSKATEVNVTEESIDDKRLGSGDKAILEAKKAGSYWILKEGKTDYLVPKKHLTFNQHQYKTAQALFQCQGYQPSFRQKFHVLKPARVTPIYGDKWQLEEMGSLEFY
ncbi:MAG: hypothetical protein RMZ69_03775 [Nostoc sp. ChiQUE01a]|nr:hypothetical protein [Nostoc sp. ChiQUE01a]